MVTDPARIHPHDLGHPDVCPVHHYHQALEPVEAARVASACREGQVTCVEHKKAVTALLAERLEPYRRIRREMGGHEDDLWDILRQGSLRARALAQETLGAARERMGVPDLRVAPVRAISQATSLDLAGKVCC